MSSTNSVVNRSTNTSNVSGLGSVSGTDGGGIVYKPIKPTVGTHIPKVPGMKKPGRVGFGWIADLSVVVQMLKSAGIEADDDDPRALFQSLNRAKTIQQIAVADKMAKLTGTSIDRNTMLSDFQTALDVYDKSAKEWSKHTEEIADTLHDVKQSILSKIWKDGGTRTDRANDMVAQWSKQKMNQHAGSSPGDPTSYRFDPRDGKIRGGTERSQGGQDHAPDHYPKPGDPDGPAGPPAPDYVPDWLKPGFWDDEPDWSTTDPALPPPPSGRPPGFIPTPVDTEPKPGDPDFKVPPFVFPFGSPGHPDYKGPISPTRHPGGINPRGGTERSQGEDQPDAPDGHWPFPPYTYPGRIPNFPMYPGLFDPDGKGPMPPIHRPYYPTPNKPDGTQPPPFTPGRWPLPPGYVVQPDGSTPPYLLPGFRPYPGMPDPPVGPPQPWIEQPAPQYAPTVQPYPGPVA